MYLCTPLLVYKYLDYIRNLTSNKHVLKNTHYFYLHSWNRCWNFSHSDIRKNLFAHLFQIFVFVVFTLLHFLDSPDFGRIKTISWKYLMKQNKAVIQFVSLFYDYGSPLFRNNFSAKYRYYCSSEFIKPNSSLSWSQ